MQDVESTRFLMARAAIAVLGILLKESVRMRCPKCGSERAEKLNRGAKFGGAVGAAAGGIGGALLGAITGGAAGSKVGKELDENVLNNRKCLDCGHEWHDE